MTILRTFKASIGGHVFPVEQVHFNRHRQDIGYVIDGTLELTSNEYWDMNPKEVEN